MMNHENIRQVHVLYGPFVLVICIVDERFLDKPDSKIIAQDAK